MGMPSPLNLVTSQCLLPDIFGRDLRRGMLWWATSGDLMQLRRVAFRGEKMRTWLIIS